MITTDEVYLAGGADDININYYLYNRQNYWTMSPTCWAGLEIYSFLVGDNGNIGSAINSTWDEPGLRPVINLKADIQISGGNGTINDPYEVI